MTFFFGEEFERGLLLCSMILAAGSLCWGFRLHRRWRGLFALAAGTAMILAGRSAVDEVYQIPLVLTGALFIAASHLANRHLCRMCLLCPEQEKKSLI
jgi:hypothetical protein